MALRKSDCKCLSLQSDEFILDENISHELMKLQSKFFDTLFG